MNISQIHVTICIMAIKPLTNLDITKLRLLVQQHNCVHRQKLLVRYNCDDSTKMAYLTKHRMFFSLRYFWINWRDSPLSMLFIESDSWLRWNRDYSRKTQRRWYSFDIGWFDKGNRRNSSFEILTSCFVKTKDDRGWFRMIWMKEQMEQSHFQRMIRTTSER